MDTTTINGTQNTAGKTVTTPTSSLKSVGKDEFMKLLLAQLKNQDPLKPMDGTDFAVQLAQFTSLEQLSSLNTELKAQSVNQMMLGYAQSANIIGKEAVTASGNGITGNGQTVDLHYNLSGDAQNVTISILDKDGKVVAIWDEPARKAGMNRTTWDSSSVDKGEYTFQVAATDATGGPVAADTMTAGVVTAVHFRGNQILATINGREVPLSQIIELKATTDT